MARHRDADWSLPDQCQNWEQVSVAVLMDLRSELKMLNGLLRCRNFLGIPDTLRAISKNTTKKRRRARLRMTA